MQDSSCHVSVNIILIFLGGRWCQKVSPKWQRLRVHDTLLQRCTNNIWGVPARTQGVKWVSALRCWFWKHLKGPNGVRIPSLFSVVDNGPCLGSRKPNQPYEWLSYQEVSCRVLLKGNACLNSNVLFFFFLNVLFLTRSWTEHSTSVRPFFTEVTFTQATSSLASFHKTDPR